MPKEFIFVQFFFSNVRNEQINTALTCFIHGCFYLQNLCVARTKKKPSLVWWSGSGSQQAGWRRSGPDKTYGGGSKQIGAFFKNNV